MSVGEVEASEAVSAQAFDVHVERDGVELRLSPTGQLDLSTGVLLESHLDVAACAGHDRVLLDLRGLDFMDSTGVRLILVADAQLRAAGRQLRLIPGRPTVQRVFELSNLDTVLQFDPA